VARQDDPPLIRCQDVAVEVGEEFKRLGRHAVALAGLAQQMVKIPDRRQLLGELDRQTALLGLAQGPADGAV